MDEQEPINEKLAAQEALNDVVQMADHIQAAVAEAQELRGNEFVDGRCLSLVITKLEEAQLWLEKAQAVAAGE